MRCRTLRTTRHIRLRLLGPLHPVVGGAFGDAEFLGNGSDCLDSLSNCWSSYCLSPATSFLAAYGLALFAPLHAPDFKQFLKQMPPFDGGYMAASRVASSKSIISTGPAGRRPWRRRGDAVIVQRFRLRIRRGPPFSIRSMSDGRKRGQVSGNGPTASRMPSLLMRRRLRALICQRAARSL